MFEKADAFVTLPGGNGTLEESVEAGTEYQLGLHQKPMIFVNINGFWNPLFALYKDMRQAGFINARIPLDPVVVNEVPAIIPKLRELWGEPMADNVVRLGGYGSAF